jgi:hypothetical protein
MLRPVPTAHLKSFPRDVIQLWCVKRGVYQLPTTELIEWLNEKIGFKRAIEICAGNGVLGRALSIIRTDSFMQTRPDILAYYRAFGQEPIAPPTDVIKLDANNAVKKFLPQVVIGAWVTQLYQEGDKDGSMYGVDEFDIIKQVESYIHIGNDGPHGSKRSLSLPHKKYRFDWLVSRGQDQSLNHIVVYKGGANNESS